MSRCPRLIVDSPFTVKSIISYGLIVYCVSTERWLMVQRKHSAEFLLFMRGIYRVSYLPLLLQHITAEEGQIILRCLSEPQHFRHVFLHLLQLEQEELEYSLTRFIESGHLVRQLLSQIDLTTNTLTWGWPKGRLQNFGEKELPFNCAQREFQEEIEAPLQPPLFISDNYVTEYIKTLTGRTIESRYWVYLIAKEIPVVKPRNHLEVSDRRWVNRDECLKLINHDNLFYEVEQIVKMALRSGIV